MLRYPVQVTPEGDDAVMLTFPDVPEAVVVGRCEDDAFRGAPKVLEAILATYVVVGRPIPTPSEADGKPTVSTRKFTLVGINPVG